MSSINCSFLALFVQSVAYSISELQKLLMMIIIKFLFCLPEFVWKVLIAEV